MMEGASCKQCAANDRNANLILFQINLEEAIWMCPSKECTFPLGALALSDTLVRRRVSEITDVKRRRKAKTKPPANSPKITCDRKETEKVTLQNGEVSPTSWSDGTHVGSPVIGDTAVTPLICGTPVICGTPGIIDSPAMCNTPEICDTPSIDDTPDVAVAQRHSSYVADRGQRNNVARPVTCDQDNSLLASPSPLTTNALDSLVGKVLSWIGENQSPIINHCNPAESDPGLPSSNPEPPLSNLGVLSSNSELPMSNPEPPLSNLGVLSSNSELPMSNPGLLSSNPGLPSSNPGLSSNPGPLSNAELPSSNHGRPSSKPVLSLSSNRPVNSVVEPRPPDRCKYLQWSNVDALCWMDVALCLLVHCTTLKALVATSGADCVSLVRSLIVRYEHILDLWDNRTSKTGCKGRKPMTLETSVGKVSVKTGGGEIERIVTVANISDDTRSNDSVYESNTGDKVNKSRNCDGNLSSVTTAMACRMLGEIRDGVLACQPKLSCERGHNHSPVFALPLLLGCDDLEVQDLFLVEYCWRMTCSQCRHSHEDRVAKTVPTFPAVPRDFSMERPYFLRACFKCGSPGQRMEMDVERMPPTLLVHFVEGLCGRHLTNYDFEFNGATYAVTGLIQRKSSPNHFIAWIRDVRSKCYDETVSRWMMCDDLRSPVCQFSKRAPAFPPSQVHIVMWERQPDCVSPVTDVQADRRPTTTAIAATTTVTRVSIPTTTARCGVPTVAVPPGVYTVVANPVVPTPPFVATDVAPSQQLLWMTVSPVASSIGTPLIQQPPIAASPVTTVTDTTTVTGGMDSRVMRGREKFERAKAAKRLAAARTKQLAPVRPTVIYASPRHGTNSWVASGQDANELPTIVVRQPPSVKRKSRGARATVTPLSNPPAITTPPCSTVTSRAVRPIPVSAGYTAKTPKQDGVISNAAVKRGANGSTKSKQPYQDANELPTIVARQPSSVNQRSKLPDATVSTLATTLPTVACSAVTTRVVRPIPVFAGYTAKTHQAKPDVATSNAAVEGGAKSSSKTKRLAVRVVSTPTPVSTPVCTISKSTTTCTVSTSTSTCVTTTSCAGKNSGARSKRRKLCDAPSPPTTTGHVTSGPVSQTLTSPTVCPTVVDVPISDKLSDVIDDLCSTLSDVPCATPDNLAACQPSQLMFDGDDVIDFGFLLAS